MKAIGRFKMKNKTNTVSPSGFEPYIRGEKKNLVIVENEHFIAIVDEKPISPGHCVVFPRRVEDAFLDLSDAEISGIMIFAKSVGKALKKAVTCDKIGIAVIGIQTRHAHVHLVPINGPDDLNFTRARGSPPLDELNELADQVRSKLI